MADCVVVGAGPAGLAASLALDARGVDHVVLERGADAGKVLDGLGDCLAGHFDIEHSTFQLEQPEHRGHEGATHR
jgi:2-polyprenyl-6-methoxyphenol hydroxylase-like FAD-dependent oxidoreductase